MTAFLVDVQVDGSTVETDVPVTLAGAGIEWIDVGLIGGTGDKLRKFRNIKVGTTGWGSTDVFNPALTSSGDFNAGIFGAGGLTIAGGEIDLTSPPAGAAFAEQDFGSAFTDIYIQLDYQYDSSDDIGDPFLFVYDDGFNIVDGFELDHFAGTIIDEGGGWGPLALAPADNVWQTIAFRYHAGTGGGAALGVTPTPVSIVAAGSGAATITTDGTGSWGADTSIALTVSDLPYGLSGVFAANPITPGDTTTYTITAISGAPGGSFSLTFTATGSPSAAVHVVTITVNVSGDATLRQDAVTATEQYGGNMESAAYNSTVWEVTQNADPVHASATAQDVPGPRMIRHAGTFYIVHMEPNSPPMVHYWDGSAWVATNPETALLAHYGSFVNHNFIAEYDIASDGTDLWLTYRWWQQALPGPPPVYAGYISLLKLSGGSWSFVDDQFIDQGTSLRHTTHNVAAYSGVAYVELLAGDVQVCFDSAGNTYGGIPTLAGVYPTNSTVVAEGGTPFILAVYFTDSADYDTGAALRSHDLDGTLIEAQDEIDVIGPVADRPLNVRFSDVGDATFANSLYYVNVGGPVVTVSPDGATFGNVSGAVENDWARPLEFGSIAWDTDGAKPWIIDAYGEPTTHPLVVYALQPPCASEIWPYPLRWEKLVNGEGPGQSFYIPTTTFGINTEILLGTSFIDGDYIYTALTICQIDGANPFDTSDPAYNAHVQVWKSRICRGCAACPGIALGNGLYAHQFF